MPLARKRQARNSTNRFRCSSTATVNSSVKSRAAANTKNLPTLIKLRRAAGRTKNLEWIADYRRCLKKATNERGPEIGSRRLRSDLTAFSRTARHRTMKLWLSSALAISLHSFSSLAQHQPLPRSTPEAQGISSLAIQDFVSTVDRIDTLHSLMLLRHGQVIAAGWWKPEAADKPHVLHPLSKSFNCTAVGLAIAEGKLSLDDPVLKFFPGEAPPAP